MAKVKKRSRPFYTAKLTFGRLFPNSGKYCDNEIIKKMKKRAMLKRFKKRCCAIYDRLFDEMDSYYRENAKFIYSISGQRNCEDVMFEVDFYTHQEEQRRAKENTFNKKMMFRLGSIVKTDKVYTGRIVFKKDRWFYLKKHQMDRINKYGHDLQKKIDELK